MKHLLKTDREVFEASLSGKKTYEIRFNDRDFKVGDILELSETRFTGDEMRNGMPLEYTGRHITKTVSHVLTGYALQEGWCILSYSDAEVRADAVDKFVEWAADTQPNIDCMLDDSTDYIASILAGEE